MANKLLVVYGHVIVIGLTAAMATDSIAAAILAMAVSSLAATLVIMRG